MLDPTSDPAALKTLAARDADFAVRLLARLESEGPNRFVSPTSIRMAFAMAHAGAKDDTASEMAKALGFGSTSARDVAAGVSAMLGAFDARAVLPKTDPSRAWELEAAKHKRVILRVVNRLWGQRDHAFVPDFTKTLDTSFRAPLETLDFAKDPELARGRINGWVSDRTESKVQDLLAPRTVTTATRLVLTNAVYFRASWQKEFVPYQTKPAPFTTASGAVVQVPTMHQGGHWNYAETDAAQILSMPYGDPSLEMIVVLPKAKNGLGALEASMRAADLDRWAASAKDRRVDVAFPKFRVGSSFDLVKTMRALGMVKAFEEGVADFRGMDGTRDLFLGTAVHKAWIDVNEEGTEAAAATAVGAVGAGMPPPETPTPFVADHPFFFYVRDTKAKTILFAGHVADPSVRP